MTSDETEQTSKHFNLKCTQMYLFVVQVYSLVNMQKENVYFRRSTFMCLTTATEHFIKAEYKYNMFIIDLWNMKKIVSG